MMADAALAWWDVKQRGHRMSLPVQGLIAMISAALFWGLAPIFFKALSHVSPMEILGHRVLWSVVVFGLLFAVQGRLGEIVSAFRDRRAVLMIALASTLIMSGWYLFIWAIHSGRVTQTALGFYIAPLFAALLGRVLFQERLNRLQGVAVALMALAVLILSIGLGASPWIALALAANFGFYGVIKKGLKLGPVITVAIEVTIMIPVAAWWLWQSSHNGGGHFGSSMGTTLLLIASGPMTAMPLILFSFATRHLTLTSTGVISYINPSLQFFCAVILYREPFTGWHVTAFSLIWSALGLYSISVYLQERRVFSPASAAAPSGTQLR